MHTSMMPQIESLKKGFIKLVNNHSLPFINMTTKEMLEKSMILTILKQLMNMIALTI